MCGSRAGWGIRDPDPLENRNDTGFLIDTGPITKLPSQHSMLGHDRPAIETPFTCKWCLEGGPIVAYFMWYLVPTKTKKKKPLSSDKLFWIRIHTPLSI